VHVVRNACGYSGNALNSGRFNLGSSSLDPQIAGMFLLLIFSPHGLNYSLVFLLCLYVFSGSKRYLQHRGRRCYRSRY
jgi:hypothetical protein